LPEYEVKACVTTSIVVRAKSIVNPLVPSIAIVDIPGTPFPRADVVSPLIAYSVSAHDQQPILVSIVIVTVIHEVCKSDHVVLPD